MAEFSTSTGDFTNPIPRVGYQDRKFQRLLKGWKDILDLRPESPSYFRIHIKRLYKRNSRVRYLKGLHRPAVRLRAHIQLPQRNQPGHADYHLHSPVSALGHIKHIHKDALCQRSDFLSAHPLSMTHRRVFSLHIRHT